MTSHRQHSHLQRFTTHDLEWRPAMQFNSITRAVAATRPRALMCVPPVATLALLTTAQVAQATGTGDHAGAHPVGAILAAWGVSALLLLGLAVYLGRHATVHPGPMSILIDNRGRFSLNHLQVVTWSLVLVSLVAGVFFGRLLAGVPSPLDFSIPDDVLGLLGIGLGSGVTAGAVKAAKNRTASARLSTKANGQAPRFEQVFMLEEGANADEVVDVTKFQSFSFTAVLVLAYIAMAIHTILEAKSADDVMAVPGLSSTFLVLLGITYAGYVGGKLPPQP
jgi:hypothetical protein